MQKREKDKAAEEETTWAKSKCTPDELEVMSRGFFGNQRVGSAGGVPWERFSHLPMIQRLFCSLPS